MFELKSLCELHLGKNMITVLPGKLWSCKSLCEFDVSDNQLKVLPYRDSIHRTFSQPVHIAKADNVLVGKAVVKAPSTFLNQQTLSTIHALNTSEKVSTDNATFVYDYSSLQKLNISNNKFSAFPEALPCFAPNLTNLDISRNPLKELDVHFLPLMLKKLTANNCELQRVGNVITKSHQIQITQNCQLDGLACQHRAHTYLPHLVTLVLSNNRLTHMQLIRHQPADKSVNFGDSEKVYDHKIFPTLDLLYPSMKNLYLIRNDLVGTFNPNIGHQKNLEVIHLSDNALLEKIPMEFGYLKKTKKLCEFCMKNLPKLVDPPPEYQKVTVTLHSLLTYMKARLKK